MDWRTWKVPSAAQCVREPHSSKKEKSPCGKPCWNQERGRGVHGLDPADTQQDLLSRWRSFWASLYVCLGRVICIQGAIETTNNNSSTKWLALIKSRLLWLYLSAVITRNSVMRGFFIFHLHQIPCISISILLWSPRYLQIQWCCFSLVGRFSVLI